MLVKTQRSFKSHKAAKNTIQFYLKLYSKPFFTCYELSGISSIKANRRKIIFLTHLCNNTVKKRQYNFLIMKSRKKTNNYFTKLHNSCYNVLYYLLF